MATRLLVAPVVDLPDDALAARAQGGDTGALQALLDRYRRFARSRSRGYFLVGGDAEDLEQEALIGLYKAIRDFRPGHESSFRAFAELCVTRQIITAIKTATRHKHQPLNQYVSLSPTHRDDDTDAHAVDDLLEDRRATDPADAVLSAERLACIRASMAALLSEFEVDVLRLYVEGNSYQAIGATLGRHAKSIDNALQRIKRKLDQHLRAEAEAERVAELVAA